MSCVGERLEEEAEIPVVAVVTRFCICSQRERGREKKLIGLLMLTAK